MKVLFCALHFGYFRNFESVIVSLAERGHHIHLAADERDALGGESLVERLAAAHPSITYGYAPAIDQEPWFKLAQKLRMGTDYVRFHGPAFHTFRKTRANLADRVPRFVRLAMDGGAGRAAWQRALGRALRAAESLLPISEASRRFIASQNPDLVLLASATIWRAPQLDHLRAARALGVRTGVCVFSWDQLSSKALLRFVPDRVFLWNETQKREAIEWHGMPADRIVVTGAQCWDQWFGRAPSRDRDAFCRAVGLLPEHPILLYVCSVMAPDPRESQFVVRWIEHLRQSASPVLRQAGILIRPHPERLAEWQETPLGRFANVAVHGRNPISPEARDDYFDSLYHSHAVVGLVTSAFIEAAVVGRSVHTVQLPEFALYQDGLQHFRYLVEIEGGLLEVSRTFDEHLRQLEQVLSRPPARDPQNERFVRAFVRPYGLETPATPRFVEAIETMAAAAALAPLRPGVWHRAVQPLVCAVARSAERGWLRPLIRDTLERETDLIEAQKAASRATAASDKARRMADKQQMLAGRRRERRRQQWAGARRKYVAQFKGHLKTLVGRS